MATTNGDSHESFEDRFNRYRRARIKVWLCLIAIGVLGRLVIYWLDTHGPR